ncbi:hypothetical protein DFJ73DRAFT_959444 [Zopfochytrium polystomum]|nr:hypothetical protein DFJ73DRAFT_959444 [Zopfochytrium polystomum]
MAEFEIKIVRNFRRTMCTTDEAPAPALLVPVSHRPLLALAVHPTQDCLALAGSDHQVHFLPLSGEATGGGPRRPTADEPPPPCVSSFSQRRGPREPLEPGEIDVDRLARLTIGDPSPRRRRDTTTRDPQQQWRKPSSQTLVAASLPAVLPKLAIRRTDASAAAAAVIAGEWDAAAATPPRHRHARDHDHHRNPARRLVHSHSDWVTAVQFAGPASAPLCALSGAADASVVRWADPTRRRRGLTTTPHLAPAACPSPHAAPISAVVVPPVTPLAAVASYDGSLSLWDCRDDPVAAVAAPGRLLAHLLPATASTAATAATADPVLGARFAPSGRTVVSHTRAGCLVFHNVETTATAAATDHVRAHRSRVVAALCPAAADWDVVSAAVASAGGDRGDGGDGGGGAVARFDLRVDRARGRRVARRSRSLVARTRRRAVRAGVPEHMLLAVDGGGRLAVLDLRGGRGGARRGGGSGGGGGIGVVAEWDPHRGGGEGQVAAAAPVRVTVRAGGGGSGFETVRRVVAAPRAGGGGGGFGPSAAPSAAGEARPAHRTAYAVAGVGGGQCAVAWGDGRVAVVAAAVEEKGAPTTRWLDAAAWGVKDALRGLAGGSERQMLVGAGDNGLVVGWRV